VFGDLKHKITISKQLISIFFFDRAPFFFFYLKMSTEEKDTVKFVTEEEINKASSEDQQQQQEPEGQAAAFNPETGEINWDCPCKIFLIQHKYDAKK
jgi:hypothetical protein